MPATAIAAGSTLVVLGGGFGSTPQQLTLVASWITQCAQILQTPSATTVAFNVPCPPGGGFLYWNQINATSLPSLNQPLISGVVSIPAGDTSVIVTGIFRQDDYQVALTTSWLTDSTVVSNVTSGLPLADACQFTALFSVPSPPGGGRLYYTIIFPPPVIESGQVSTLQDYLDELRRLLHDENDQYWSIGTKTSNINRALQRRDVDTGANRILVPFVFTIGKDTYSFNDLNSLGPLPYAPILTTRGRKGADWLTSLAVTCERATNFDVAFAVPPPTPPGPPEAGSSLQWSVPLIAATGVVAPVTSTESAAFSGSVMPVTARLTTVDPPRIFDVVGINLIYISNRVVLLNMSFTKLNVLKRPWVPYQAITEGWARYGTSQVVFGPQPSLNYLTEWDVCVYSPQMAVPTDIDPVPFPYTLRLVPTYAAYLCKQNERQMDEAQMFLADYMREADVARNQRVGMLPNAYGKASYSF